ncbi:MAG: helix-turn-helix transcriptional regulator [Pararhodobacter sp.]|nr:helix-turn-helix transcriptional regulator [Pararhodobacter sp.]
MNAQAEPLNLELMREAILTSTLNHGLRLLGDRWTVQVLMGAFMGIKRFDDFQAKLGIPRHTLSDRLKALVAMDMMRPRPYSQRPLRHAYHLTRKGLAMYDAVLMVWDWEHRFGEHDLPLPRRLKHKSCGHAFLPELTCGACGEQVTMHDLRFRLRPNRRLPHDGTAPARTPRVPVGEGAAGSLGLRLDRWALLIVSAVTLGCRYFDELSQVLQIGPSVLARRLSGMVEAGLLRAEPDPDDGRRRRYRLTPASRALFGYITCFAAWASEHHFNEPSSIAPVHRACGHPFAARAACSHCHQPLLPWEVEFEPPAEETT